MKTKEELAIELNYLKCTVFDLLSELDSHGCEVPLILYDQWNELEDMVKDCEPIKRV